MKTINVYTSKDIEKALSQKDKSGLSFPSKIFETDDQDQIMKFLEQQLKLKDVVKIVINDSNSLLNLMVP